MPMLRREIDVLNSFGPSLGFNGKQSHASRNNIEAWCPDLGKGRDSDSSHSFPHHLQMTTLWHPCYTTIVCDV